MAYIDTPSPNFDERGDTKIDTLVIHYTAMESNAAALERLTDPDSKVSAHYLIDEDGTVYKLVDEDKRAWHAGQGAWDGDTDVNSSSIGIELYNPGHNRGYRDFPEAQMRALEKLCSEITSRQDIRPEKVIGHSDLAPHRKQDPGELFDWQRLADAGVGLKPKPQLRDAFNAKAVAKDEKKLVKLFRQAGYDITTPAQKAPDLQQVLIAFQRHHQQEAFKTGGNLNPDGSFTRAGAADHHTVIRLRALIRARGKTPAA